MNLHCVRTVKDSGVRSAIKPAPYWSRHPSGSVRTVREPDVFIAGLPGGQNQRVSTIDPPLLDQENFASIRFGITHSSNSLAKYLSVIPAIKSRTSSASVAVSRYRGLIHPVSI
jgi:hypothetical protein